MTPMVPLVAFCVMLQCGLTQTGILEKRSDTWYINQNSQAINGRSHEVRKESTECTCTCEVKVTGTPTGQGHPEASTTQDEGLQGGWSNGHEDGWSSDGQASEEESPIQWTPDDHSSTDDHQPPPLYTEDNAANNNDNNDDNNNNNNNNRNKMVDNVLDNEAPDRYTGYSWGHGRRHPWKTLKDTMCIRQSCKWDSDCCYRWNICDKSAKVCTNCWYGHPCLSEKDCCFDFPYCQRKWKLDENGQRTGVESGRCADQRLN